MYLPELGYSSIHKYDGERKTIIAPTCTEAGWDGIFCSVCKNERAYQDIWVAPLGHTEETVSGKAATCTEAGLTDGKHCSVCDTVLVAQNSISAKGHSFWGEWSSNKNNYHRRYCQQGCGQYVSVSCEFMTTTIDDNKLAICPICGWYRDKLVGRQKEASISSLTGKVPGTVIVRALLNPVNGDTQCLAVITAVYERNGRVVTQTDSTAPYTVKLPLPINSSFKLFFITVDEQTQDSAWIPVEYTFENDNLVFTVNQLGMFLLIAE